MCDLFMDIQGVRLLLSGFAFESSSCNQTFEEELLDERSSHEKFQVIMQNVFYGVTDDQKECSDRSQQSQEETSMNLGNNWMMSVADDLPKFQTPFSPHFLHVYTYSYPKDASFMQSLGSFQIYTYPRIQYYIQ